MKEHRREFINVENLNSKKITEFTKEDTIYIQQTPEPGHPQLVYCQFEKYEKGAVHGRVISYTSNPQIYERSEGNVIKGQLSKCALYGSADHESRSGFFHWFDASTGRALDPRTEYKVVESQLHVKKHPSFGMAAFSRFSSNANQPLFGSSIQSKQMISLRISTAEHDRDINHDRYHADRRIVEVVMSQSQFAELITSFNQGEGVPVTIRNLNGERMPAPPFTSKVDMFKDEFKNKMHNMGVDIERTAEDAMDILKNKERITKADREHILSQIERLLMEIRSNVPYVGSQFAEQMEKTVTEAKAEIESFVNNKVHALGMEALREEMGTPSIEAPRDRETHVHVIWLEAAASAEEKYLEGLYFFRHQSRAFPKAAFLAAVAEQMFGDKRWDEYTAGQKEFVDRFYETFKVKTRGIVNYAYGELREELRGLPEGRFAYRQAEEAVEADYTTDRDVPGSDKI